MTRLPERALWLQETDLSRRTIRRLLSAVSGMEELEEVLCCESGDDLRLRFPGEDQAIGRVLAARERSPRQTAEELEKKGIRYAAAGFPAFPSRLLTIPDPPLGLYWIGRLPSEELPGAAVIGSRDMTGYGRSMGSSLAGALSLRGVQVISGMARGIDAEAGTAALKGLGGSFAVLGCGADVCYPGQNRELYERLCAEGGILSEYPPGTEAAPFRFPERNRLIAGLSDVVCVAEAGEKSGTVITATQALEQGKDVLAIPGRVTDPMSRGCNRLIREGAGILTSLSDVLEVLKIPEKHEGTNVLEALVLACAETGMNPEETAVHCSAYLGRRIDETELRGVRAGLLAGGKLVRSGTGRLVPLQRKEA